MTTNVRLFRDPLSTDSSAATDTLVPPAAQERQATTPPPATEGAKPQTIDKLGYEIVDVSPELEKVKNDGTSSFYRMITISKDGVKSAFAVGKKFFDRNDLKLVIGNTVDLQFEQTIKGKTQWLNKATGKFQMHTSTGTNLRNISATTAGELKKNNARDFIALIKKEEVTDPAVIAAIAMLMK